MGRLRFPRVRAPGSDRPLPKCRACPLMKAEPEPVRPLGPCVIVLVRTAFAAKLSQRRARMGFMLGNFEEQWTG